MPHTVEVPDVGTIEFPDSMSDDEIHSALLKQFPPKSENVLASSTLDVPKFEPPPIPPLTPEEEASAKAPWYKPPRQYEESIFGITPEGVPAGKTPLEAVGRATEKTALGLAQFATSPKGMTQIGATFTPAAPVVYAKWAWDMIKGGVSSIKQAKEDLTSLITDHFTQEVAGRNNLPYYSDDPKRQQELIQSLADNAVNTAASAIGAVGAVKGGVKSVRGLIPEAQPKTPPEPAPPTFEATPPTPVPPISPGLPVVPPEAPLGEPTFAPSGLSLARPEAAPQPQPATIPGTPETRALLPQPAGPEVEPPPPAIAPEYASGKAAQAVREMGAQQMRMEDFEKAVAEKVSQEQAEPLHPDKPLTANQLRIIKDSLVGAIEQNQIPGANKGIVAGSPLEAWADGVIKKSGERTRFGGIDPELAAAGVVKGAALIEKGVTEFGRWAAEMVKEFGERIRPHLKTLYEQANGLRFENFQRSTGQQPETKGAPDATKEGPLQERDQPKHPGTAPLRLSTEAGRSDSPQPVTPEEGQASRPLLLNQNPIVQKASNNLRLLRVGLSTAINARPERHQMDQLFSRIDTDANILGRQLGNHVKIDTTPTQDIAASAVIASGFDRTKLPDLISGRNSEVDAAIRYAMSHFNEVSENARRGKQVFDAQFNELNANGIPVEYAENYLPGLVDTDMWMGQGRPFVLRGRGSGAGGSTSFRKGKTYDNPFEAIKAGETVKSVKLSELVEHYVRNSQKLLNRVEWSDSLRNIVDPIDNKPIVTSVIDRARSGNLPGWEETPAGYVRRTIIPGLDVAVHEGYANLFDNLTAASAVKSFEVAGLPVGLGALELAGGIKHGLLFFDTFHVSRILQKQLFLTGEIGYKKGLTLLDYSDRDLERAVKAKEITQEMADYARANRPTANLLIDNGFNVGRIQEALYTSIVRKIPGIGSANKWIFEKMTRGAMMQSGLIEFERIKRASPNMSDTQVAQKVARDLNAYFGNLESQGVFKSKTFQDLARLFFLAPQWVESMARSEIGGVKQLAIDPIIKRQMVVGSLGAGLGKGLAAYFIATQLINLVTRKQFTWQNQEKGHKLDAWIPDATGKTPGYFLSPMAMAAELTHDIFRYAHNLQDPNALSVTAQILSNKASPLWRAGRIALGGRDFDDSKIVGFWNRAKKAGVALLPTPIPAQAPLKGSSVPGATQRQLTASLGIKTEPSPTAQKQIFDMAMDWKKQSKDPKIQADVERHLKQEFGPSDYKDLKTAIIKGNPKDIRDEYEALKEKKKTPEMIRKEFERGKPFTGSPKTERAFFNSLTPEQKLTYRAAKQEREDMLKKLKAALDATRKSP